MTAEDFCAEYRKATHLKLGLPMPQDGDVIHMGGPIMCEVMEAYAAHVLASHAPSDPSCYCGHAFNKHDRGNCTIRDCTCRLYDQTLSEAAASE